MECTFQSHTEVMEQDLSIHLQTIIRAWSLQIVLRLLWTLQFMQKIGILWGEAELLWGNNQLSDCTDLCKAVGRAEGSAWCWCCCDLSMHTIYLLEICSRLVSLLLQQRSPQVSLRGQVMNIRRAWLQAAPTPAQTELILQFLSQLLF